MWSWNVLSENEMSDNYVPRFALPTVLCARYSMKLKKILVYIQKDLISQAEFQNKTYFEYLARGTCGKGLYIIRYLCIIQI